MGKTRAEIQKEYRERKKAKDGKKYLKTETERVKKYYKPTTELGPNKLRIRRERIRKCMKKKRQYIKEIISKTLEKDNSNQNIMQIDNVLVNDEPCAGPCDSTTSVSSTLQNTENETMIAVPSTSSCINGEKMVINMKFSERRGNWKKLKAVKKAETKIKKLESQLSTLKKTNNKLRKRLERANIKSSPLVESPREKSKPKKKANMKFSPVVESPKENSQPRKSQENITKSNNKKNISSENRIELTPKRKSIEMLRNEGLSPSKHRELVKQLTFHHSLVEEVKTKIKPDRGRARQRTTLQIVCGNVLKRYRLASKSSRVLGVNRSQITKTEKGKTTSKRRKALERYNVSNSVVCFLEREDNSACLPGKRDTAKMKTGVTQLRVLNDYLYNLHMKFTSENPHIKIGLTSFSSFRPKYIKLVRFSARRTCLCQKHQNMALKVKGLKLAGVTTTENPDTLISQNSNDEILQKINDCSSETIKYSQWKRKDVEHKGRMTKRMLIENVERPKDEFINLFQNDLYEFRKHTERVKTQYTQIRDLKKNMPKNHAICQMDFAENYSCGHADEIQNAYFDKCSVTLHPVVLYTKDHEGKMSHTSYIYVSDTPAHNSGTVYAFMKKISRDLKSARPDISCIHYITDSPTSQYRNKSMMYLTANHDDIFGLKASWQYWEAGHGKGPCDGVGGTSKRLADLAVKRHIAVIQSAEDYYHWGDSIDTSQIKYVFVPKDECDQALTELSSYTMKSIKGTLEIHSVVHLKHGEIAVRNTSCFCEKCFENGEFKIGCSGWIKHTISQNDKNIESNVQEVNTSAQEVPKINEIIFAENSYVAAVYNGYWYVGKIIEYDPLDDNLQYKISFMDHGKGKICYTFKWPSKEDILWIAKTEILCVVSEPVLYGTRKMYKLDEWDINKIEHAFAKYK